MNATATRTEYLSAAQKSLATTITRGETLFTEGGYSIEPYADRPGVYSVARSENDPRPVQKGESLWNDVDIINQTCTCKAWEVHHTCKHALAVNKMVADAARLLSPLLPSYDLLPQSQDKPKQNGFESTEARKKQAYADFG